MVDVYFLRPEVPGREVCDVGRGAWKVRVLRHGRVLSLVEPVVDYPDWLLEEQRWVRSRRVVKQTTLRRAVSMPCVYPAAAFFGDVGTKQFVGSWAASQAALYKRRGIRVLYGDGSLASSALAGALLALWEDGATLYLPFDDSYNAPSVGGWIVAEEHVGLLSLFAIEMGARWYSSLRASERHIVVRDATMLFALSRLRAHFWRHGHRRLLSCVRAYAFVGDVRTMPDYRVSLLTALAARERIPLHVIDDEGFGAMVAEGRWFDNCPRPARQFVRHAEADTAKAEEEHGEKAMV